MKIILMLIILSATCYAQTITVDPNSIIIGPEFVKVNMQLVIEREQYKAMQERDLTFQQMIDRARIPHVFVRLYDLVKRVLSQKATIQQLKDLEN